MKILSISHSMHVLINLINQNTNVLIGMSIIKKAKVNNSLEKH